MQPLSRRAFCASSAAAVALCAAARGFVMSPFAPQTISAALNGLGASRLNALVHDGLLATQSNQGTWRGRMGALANIAIPSMFHRTRRANAMVTMETVKASWSLDRIVDNNADQALPEAMRRLSGIWLGTLPGYRDGIPAHEQHQTTQDQHDYPAMNLSNTLDLLRWGNADIPARITSGHVDWAELEARRDAGLMPTYPA